MASYMPRENPPEPPRLGWSIMRRLLPRDLRAAGKRSSSTTFLLPWSTTTTSLSTSGRVSEAPSWPSTVAQSVGRLKVVMPIVALPRGVSAGTRASHRAASTTASSESAATSNQYQPPSPKVLSGSSKTSSADSVAMRAESTRCEAPRALDL